MLTNGKRYMRLFIRMDQSAHHSSFTTYRRVEQTISQIMNHSISWAEVEEEAREGQHL
jgi:hypothetical protein